MSTTATAPTCGSERVAAWLAANGIDPSTVRTFDPIDIETRDGVRVIRYIVRPPGSGGRIREHREVPLIAEFDGGTP